MSNELPRLLVCERRGSWAAALREDLARECATSARPGLRTLPIHEARSLVEALAFIESLPTAVALVEWEVSAPLAVLEFVLAVDRRYPRARTIVVGGAGALGWAPALRMVGAIYLATSPRRLAPAAEFIERYLAQCATAGEQTFSEQIWASLPWKEAAGPRTN